MPPRDQAHITNFLEEPLWVMNRDGISLRQVVPPTLSKALSAEPMRGWAVRTDQRGTAICSSRTWWTKPSGS